ncbi:MAG: hypothetical protein EPN91_12510 [Salinibacterium sp.]|nr:MAG: hypothetical protein EPN91_12510 [Salinibacterium sp.]
MDRSLLMVIVLCFLFVLLALMVLGWNTRQQRQSDIAKPALPPADRGPVFGTFRGMYVSTTTSGDPLDRIAVHGLAFRGNVDIVVSERGVLLSIPGVDEIWIPTEDLVELRRATWTIDRVVEHDGLHVIEWNLGDRAVETYLRMLTPTEFDHALQRLLAMKGRQ